MAVKILRSYKVEQTMQRKIETLEKEIIQLSDSNDRIEHQQLWPLKFYKIV